jgi:hypothetical protein
MNPGGARQRSALPSHPSAKRKPALAGRFPVSPEMSEAVGYFRTISTRRFCGSRTPAAVGTSGREKP